MLESNPSASRAPQGPWATCSFVGLDVVGNVRYGPIQRPWAPRIQLDDVPVSVVSMLIEELDSSGAGIELYRGGVRLTPWNTTTLVKSSSAHLEALVVTPAGATIAAGTAQAFTATGVFSDQSTCDLTTQARWSSSDPAVVRFANPSGASGHGQQGEATAIAPGTATITAVVAQKTGSAVVTVTAAALRSIGISPPQCSVHRGLSIQFTAQGQFSDGTTQDLTQQVTWDTSDHAVATIAAGGMGQGVGTGSVNVTASLGSVVGVAILTVTPAILTGITVRPPDETIAWGTQQQFAASGTYSDQSTQDVTPQVTWDTSDHALATISTQGLLSALGVGNVTVSARVGDVTGTTSLTVSGTALQSLRILPNPAQIHVGSKHTLSATGTYGNQTCGDLTTQVTWSSSDPTVLSVSPTGVVQALAAGPATVTASMGNVSAQASILVVPNAYAYTLSFSSGFVRQFSMDGQTGALSRITDFPFTQTSSNVGMVLTPSGRFAYLAGLNTNTIEAFSVDATTGTLQAVPGSPFPVSGSGPSRIAIDPTSSYLYTNNFHGTNLEGFRINPQTGALSVLPSSPFACGSQPASLAITPNGRFLYAGNGGFNAPMNTYSIDPATGELTLLAQSNLMQQVSRLMIDSRGRFIYGTNTTATQGVYAASIGNNGTLGAIPGSPFTDTPYSLALDPTDRFLYTVNGYSSLTGGFSVDQASGVLTTLPGSPFAGGNAALSLAVDGTGRFVYVADNGGGVVIGYTISPTGALVRMPSTFPTGLNPFCIVLTP